MIQYWKLLDLFLFELGVAVFIMLFKNALYPVLKSLAPVTNDFENAMKEKEDDIHRATPLVNFSGYSLFICIAGFHAYYTIYSPLIRLISV